MIALTNTLASSRKNANMLLTLLQLERDTKDLPEGGRNLGGVGTHDPTHSRKGAGSLGLFSSYRHAHKDQRLGDPQSNRGQAEEERKC